MSNPAHAVFYLNEYLFAKEKGLEIDFDVDNIEIEHIMPSSGKNIEGVRTEADMSKDEFDEYVNKLGNKILLEKKINGRISDKWFSLKKQNSINNKRDCGYVDSKFPIAFSLTEYPKEQWTKDDIDLATEKAAERIVTYIFD